MRRVIRLVKCTVATALAGALFACSGSNSGAPGLNASGQHPAGWRVDHRASALANVNPCMGCHGSDLKGGIAKVSCFSEQFNGLFCHAGGPSGPVHPNGWVTNHQAAALASTNPCLECHGSDLKGGTSGVSCSSAQFNGQFCHAGGPTQSPHPAGWRDPGLHGATAKGQPGPTSGFSYCQACHGTDFSGGIVNISCFVGSRATGSCHLRNGSPVSAPHAALPWRTYPFPTHTETVDDAAGLNAAVCAQCHTAGNNLTTPILPAPTYVSGKPGCFNSTLCHGSLASPHPPGWVSPSKHCIAARANLDSCQTCHADKPTGGAGSNPRFNVPLGRLVDTATGTSGCEVCHAPLAAHPRVVQIPAVFGNLTTFTTIGTPWYLHCKASPSGFDTCNRCHGANLDGVGAVAGATGCTFCHRSGLPTTQLHCTSCHAEPPNGTVYPNIARVHAVHINGTFSPAFTCDDCHHGLGSISLDHFNRAKANTTSVQAGAIVFGGFAGTGGLSPAYSDATLQCTNTYCHGATVSGGTDKAPIWSSTTYLTAAGCGTCHGFPPTAVPPHTAAMTATQCIGCHPHVNATGTGFTDTSKHINGVIDATAGGGGAAAPHSIPLPAGGYPGSVHRSVAASPFTACIGCHTIGTTIGAYPVPPGTAPDCRACHTKLAPGNSCGSCHGTASNGGRPNATAFPDVNGGHSRGDHNVSCTTCHGPNGSGQNTHGNSGGTLHNDANVVIQFTSPATGITYTRSGLGNGRGTCQGSCNGHNHNNQNW